MQDSLTNQMEVLGGIPDVGTRVTAVVIMVFVLAVVGLLLYAKMKEVDAESNER
jgi:hypothetical protein